MPKEVFTDFKRVRKILDKTKRHPREEKLEIKNKSHTIESPNIQKVCSECNEKKPIYLFNVSESGKRHKPYCKKCETLLNNPKKQGKVVKKGEVKEQKVSMVELRAEIRRNEDIQKKAKKERKKNKIKQKEKGETMEAKKTNENIFTATDYFIHTILPYIIKTKNCFTIRQIKPEFKLKINGTKEHGAVYRVLEELVNLEYLHVRKEGGGKANRYYIPRKEIGNLIREGHLTKEQTALVQPIWEEADKEEKEEKVEDNPELMKPLLVKNKVKEKEYHFEKPAFEDNGKPKQLCVLFDVEIAQRVQELAKEERISISQIIRRAVDEFIENRKTPKKLDNLIDLTSNFASRIVVGIDETESAEKIITIYCKDSISMFRLFELLGEVEREYIENPEQNVIRFTLKKEG